VSSHNWYSQLFRLCVPTALASSGASSGPVCYSPAGSLGARRMLLLETNWARRHGLCKPWDL